MDIQLKSSVLKRLTQEAKKQYRVLVEQEHRDSDHSTLQSLEADLNAL